MAILSCVFSLTMFISTAMASHLPGLLQACGASLAVAVGVGTLIGPAQVAGRLFEFGFLRRMHPLVSARLATLAHPLDVWTLPAAAFAGALTTATVVFALARRDGLLDPGTMLLCGIAINALTGAGIGLLTYLATDEQLRNLTFWSLGSLGAATWGSLLGITPAVVLIVLAVPWLMRPLNALLLGESEALHLGVPVERLKRGVVVLAAAGAGAVVAVCGVIGFIGLVAPHMARLLAGPDHRVVLPLSALIGATLLTAGGDPAADPGGV